MAAVCETPARPPIPKAQRKGKALGAKPERNRALIAAYRRKGSLRKVGALFGLTAQGVHQILERHAPEIINRKGAFDPRDPEIVEAYRAGETINQVAARIGTTRGKVWHTLNRDAPEIIRHRRGWRRRAVAA